MSLENNKIENYISTVCELVKNKDVHYDIALELKDHIQTLKEEYIDSGLSEEAAIEKAISHMGDPDLIGKQLDKTHKAKIGWGVLIPLLAFSLFGLVTMYFIQSKGAVAEADSIKIFQKNFIFYIIGIASMIGLYFFDYRKILPYSKYIYIGSVIISFLQTATGAPAYGRPYFHFGFLTIDLMPFTLVLFLISLSGILHQLNWKNPSKFLLSLGIIILPELLLLMSKSYTFYIYIIACITLMIGSKAKIYQVLSYVAIHFMCLWAMILSEPYRVGRLAIFLDPNKDPNGSGWQYLQVGKIINSSSALGNGFSIKPSTMPGIHTDFIFTYIVYTFGWIAAAIIILLVIAFVLKMIKVAKLTKNSYGKLLVSAFISMLTAEFLLNIGMNLGLSPIIDVGLPFISFGGSQLIVNMIIVGLILSVYRRKDISHNILISEQL
jgi:cell division protein FtsW (lipid II flippase)